jgi:hypothetical protein
MKAMPITIQRHAAPTPTALMALPLFLFFFREHEFRKLKDLENGRLTHASPCSTPTPWPCRANMRAPAPGLSRGIPSHHDKEISNEKHLFLRSATSRHIHMSTDAAHEAEKALIRGGGTSGATCTRPTCSSCSGVLQEVHGHHPGAATAPRQPRARPTPHSLEDLLTSRVRAAAAGRAPCERPEGRLEASPSSTARPGGPGARSDGRRGRGPRCRGRTWPGAGRRAWASSPFTETAKP